jgi:hypothetical protein
VDRPAGHVDGLDPVRRVRADCFVIAVADREIVADEAAEAGEAEADRVQRSPGLVARSIASRLSSTRRGSGTALMPAGSK